MRKRGTSKSRRAERRQEERRKARQQQQPLAPLTVPPHIAALAEQLKQQPTSSR